MNREKAKALLPIIEAYANGETIQLLYPDGKWYDIGTDAITDWSCFVDEYRIKPKPRTFYGIVYEDGSINAVPTEKERDELFFNPRSRRKITLVEVLE